MKIDLRIRSRTGSDGNLSVEDVFREARNGAETTAHRIEFARKHGLLMAGGSDCHQRPLLLGTLDLPDRVAEQFSR